jgi:hypothetical protein
VLKQVVVVLGVLLWPAAAGAQPEYWFDHVHLSVEEGPAAFSSVVYGVRVAGEEAFVLQSKAYPHVPVYDNRVKLVPRAEVEELFVRLEAAGLFELKDAEVEAPFALTWRVEAAHGGRSCSFTVKGEALLDDPRYALVVEGIRGYVEGVVGPARFRDVMVKEEELGVLNLRSYPPAEVAIDGVLLGMETPVYGLELTAGTHTLTLSCPELKLRTTRKFNIVRGEVTNLNLNLKK